MYWCAIFTIKNIILNIQIQLKKISPMVHCDKLIEKKKSPSKKVDNVREIINIHNLNNLLLCF